MQKKARLVGVALNPHQRRRVEETSEADQENQLQFDYVEEIMTLPTPKVKCFLCIATLFLRRPHRVAHQYEIFHIFQFVIDRIVHQLHNKQLCTTVYKLFRRVLMLRRSIPQMVCSTGLGATIDRCGEAWVTAFSVASGRGVDCSPTIASSQRTTRALGVDVGCFVTPVWRSSTWNVR